MGCFSTSHTDGTEGSLQSLKSLLAREQAPIPSPCMAKKIIERNLGLGTRKTLQARTNLLDTACHSLAKAKQRTLVSFPPSFYITSETTLFPLPLPPGYKPSTNSRINAKSSFSSTKSGSSSSSTKSITKSSSSSTKSTSISTNSITKSSSILTINKKIKVSNKSTKSTNSINTKSSSIPTINVNNIKSSSSSTSTNRIDVISTSSSLSFDSSTSPCHPSSNSNTNFHSSCEDLTPSSSTSSSVFSAAPSSLSQSSSFSSSSTNSSDLRCNYSLSHGIENENSFLTPLPPLSPHKLQVLGPPLKEFSPLELARACENFDDSYKLRDGAMGPIYKVFLPEENSIVAIARVATKFSWKKWKAQMQAAARLVHPNVSKVIGFSYERAKCGMNGGEGNMEVLNTGFIVYESIGHESLEEFLHDVEKGHSHIDWLTRLNIAIGVAEGLSFILEKMPISHVNYRGLTMDNIRVDLSFNAKLLDFDFSSTIDLQQKERKSCEVVQALGNVLLQLFNFIGYPQGGEAQGLEARTQKGKAYSPKDAKVVINLAASCLLTEASLRPSIRHVARVLRSIEPKHVGKFPMKRSKSTTSRRKKSLSSG